MPYSVWLTTHARYEDVLAGAPDKLTLEDLRACLALLAGSRPTREVLRPDGARWVFRQGEGPEAAPLLHAGLRPNKGVQGAKTGMIQLSVSNTHHHFLANFFELLTLAALVHETRGLNAFEGEEGQVLTVESVQRLTDRNSVHARQQGRAWMQRREQLHPQTQMPLEFPAGQQDAGPDLLVLGLEHPKLPSLKKLLAQPPRGQDVEAEDTRGVWFDVEAQQPVTWFSRSPQDAHQLLISPQWRQASFAQTAREAFDVAFQLLARLGGGGRVSWNGTPVTPGGPDWLRRHPEILGVELLQLLTLGWQPSKR